MTYIQKCKTSNPFGKYRVLHLFKRIEFQLRDSAHTHVFFWLAAIQKDLLSNRKDVIDMINCLVPVKASGNIKLQTHSILLHNGVKRIPIKTKNVDLEHLSCPSKKLLYCFL